MLSIINDLQKRSIITVCTYFHKTLALSGETNVKNDQEDICSVFSWYHLVLQRQVKNRVFLMKFEIWIKILRGFQ